MTLVERAFPARAAIPRLMTVRPEAVGKMAYHFEDKVREIANSNGTDVTLRYSPGYCDWDITQQRVLFQAMDSAPLGVSLTDECLMVPRKSVSGIIGMGRFEKRQLFKYLPCRFCTKIDCPSRRGDYDQERIGKRQLQAVI